MRSPASVISPGVSAIESRAASSGTTSSRSRSTWFGRSPSTASNTSVATGTRSGCATQVPSKPLADSRSLSSRTFARATRFTSGSLRRRDERGHAADRVRAAPVTRCNEELGVRAHERHRHRHLHAVGQQPTACAELLDHAEDVVPAAGVQRAAVVAELVEDLLHLERGEDRLDQHRARGSSRAEGRAPPPRARTPAPTAAPRGATRASAGRSTGRSRARAARARCGTSRGRSRRGSRRRTRRRPRSAARRGASRAGGSSASRSSRSAGSVFSPVSSAISRRTASRTFRWPSRTFRHVGEFASSKSAMKTRAPEFSALIIILRSTGPVISQRRSCRSAGAAATRQSLSRTCAVSGRKPGSSPASRSS